MAVSGYKARRAKDIALAVLLSALCTGGYSNCSGFNAANMAGASQFSSSISTGPSQTPATAATATPVATATPGATATPSANPTATPQQIPPAPQPTMVPAPSTTGVQAISSDMFMSSLGINTHIQQGISGSSTVAPLQYLGVRNIRDGDGAIDQLLIAHQGAGVKINIFGEGETTVLDSARTLAAAGALLSIEGPNEPNNFPITYQGLKGGGQGTWAPVAQYQKDMYGKMKADSTLKSYPMFGVSEEGGEVDNVGLQFNTIPAGAGATFPDGTVFSDYTNTHNYVCGTASQLVDNQAWNASATYDSGAWDGFYAEHVVIWYGQKQGYTLAQASNVPRATTETGWASDGTGGNAAMANQLVNTYLSQFKQGWRYTFIYMLRDGEGGTEKMGVFNSDSTAKPAAVYIHNLTSVLNDNTATANPGKLDYSIANEPATVHDLLLQKSNGTFDLVVWGENVTATSNVTVTFGSSHTINVYDVADGTTVTKTVTGNSVALSLTNHPLILEMK